MDLNSVLEFLGLAILFLLILFIGFWFVLIMLNVMLSPIWFLEKFGKYLRGKFPRLSKFEGVRSIYVLLAIVFGFTWIWIIGNLLDKYVP